MNNICIKEKMQVSEKYIIAPIKVKKCLKEHVHIFNSKLKNVRLDGV